MWVGYTVLAYWGLLVVTDSTNDVGLPWSVGTIVVALAAGVSFPLIWRRNAPDPDYVAPTGYLLAPLLVVAASILLIVADAPGTAP